MISRNYFIYFLFFTLLFLGCNKKEDILQTTIDFNEEVNFNQISLSDTILKTIVIKNIGKNNLIIDSIGTSCGCTIINRYKNNIKPNYNTEITIKFIPENIGDFKKSIVIEANTDPPFNIFYIKGKVIN